MADSAALTAQLLQIQLQAYEEQLLASPRYNAPGNLARFVRSDKTVRVRLRFRPNAPLFSFPYTVGVDQAVWLNSP